MSEVAFDPKTAAVEFVEGLSPLAQRGDQVPIGELETDSQQRAIPEGSSAGQFRSNSKPQDITGTPSKRSGFGPPQAAAMGHEQAEGVKRIEVPDGTVNGVCSKDSESRCMNASAAFEHPGDDGSVGSVTSRERPATNMLHTMMREALSQQIPRVRLTELEPPQQVAAGIVALIEKRLAEWTNDFRREQVPWLERRTIMVDEISKCLEAIGRCSLEAELQRFLNANARWRSIEIEAIEGDLWQVTLTGEEWAQGDGPTISEAFGEALKNWDAFEEAI